MAWTQQLAAAVSHGVRLHVPQRVGAVEPLEPGELTGRQADDLPADAELVEQEDGERGSQVVEDGAHHEVDVRRYLGSRHGVSVHYRNAACDRP